ncbi:urease accessory protein F isoform X2 [Juglans microcarpa x Juglans regia]|uniref:urease accessory protein F isoform X2 n=1 Tax=Juglans microcarpa x Juglans regia TaxID=2249226 RepID=UPI001B7EDB17|nr:urease accessory protein F isoform X2 [Juglans microcarpa x Juglans regia]
MKIEPALLSLKRKSDEPGGSSFVPNKKPNSVEDGEEDLIPLHSLQITIPSSTALALTQPHHLMNTFFCPMEDGMDAHIEVEKPTPTDSHLQWSQWQLIDSILPTGGFAHSFGLEAAIQARIISGPEDLRTFVIHVLENTGSLLLPFVFSATISPDLETWQKLDRTLDAMLTNEVGRKASIAQGSALMRVAAAVFSETPSLKSMRDTSVGSGVVSFHHAPIFGLTCGLLGLDSRNSQRAYLFITMRDVISAATRLNLVGPMGAAVLQHQIVVLAEAILTKWMDRTVEEACQTTPLLDTVQGCHAYLFSRLFCS